ncbi:putative benzoate 4-monooxygenase cytochrome p450 protein [Botrytis fragariae]|uniref:Putative benzoate 4-monooxygenase cytochrome p450 protein n=1 Tax=Botrytis fragariae TaxID=1964551 RepID=A0A8H6AW52_9HELO|nr:putative benzoate 4-monooxygenase cytochrome p450 protein [Botrytis fragariae]KAF5874565.1 putative benzoate 4-monooxygenase cytochrome p450 protein [Botrytis fragariae]
MPEALNDVCETYGSLARIGLNDLICSDTDFIRRMGTAKLGYRRSRFYSSFAFNPDQDTILSTADEKIHADLKMKTAAGYSGKDVENLEQSIDRQLNAFINLIERKYLSTPTSFRPFEIAKKIQYFTLDAITDVAFGTPFGCIAQDDDMYDYIKTVEQLLPAAVVAGVLPVAKVIVAKRFGESEEVQNDMLGSFIAHGLTQEKANSETLLQVIAAAIDEGVKNGKISSLVTDNEARAIPYLQAVTKEGPRKFPVIAGLLPKMVPEGGDIINGFSIPAGTDVSLSLTTITHSKATFGPDAHIFRPERWLEGGDNDKLRTINLAADLVFGSGKWSCSGKNIAMMEMGKVLVELFRRFDISLVNPTKPWKSFSAGAYIQSDLLVRFAKRTH